VVEERASPYIGGPERWLLGAVNVFSVRRPGGRCPRAEVAGPMADSEVIGEIMGIETIARGHGIRW